MAPAPTNARTGRTRDAGAADQTFFSIPQASNTIDDQPGWLLDLESGSDPEKDWGWRLGCWGLGGDNGAVPTAPGAVVPAGLANSMENTGWQAGFWWKNESFKVLTLRYDDWENEIDTLVASGTEGDAITFAWNKRINDTSMFQFECLTPDEKAITGASSDVDDDLIQFRYKVRF